LPSPSLLLLPHWSLPSPRSSFPNSTSITYRCRPFGVAGDALASSSRCGKSTDFAGGSHRRWNVPSRHCRAVPALPARAGTQGWPSMATAVMPASCVVSLASNSSSSTIGVSNPPDSVPVVTSAKSSRNATGAAWHPHQPDPVDKWQAFIGNPTGADAILDHLVHHAHRIDLAGDSLRAGPDQPQRIDRRPRNLPKIFR
jgi:hypothetical protein